MRVDLHHQLQDCRGLPSPPGVALRIIELAQDPHTVMATAANIIGLDPALSARMLRISNSPLYASRRRVENLTQALTLLGLNATLTLALGFSLLPGLLGEKPAQAQEHVWRRSVIAGLVARVLGQRMRVPQLEELMLAGLLQDIGILALLQLYPQEYAPLAQHGWDNDQLLAMERERFGCDHAEVGATIAVHWRLPDLLCAAVRDSESLQSSSLLQACVSLSGLIADMWIAQDTHAAQLRAQKETFIRLGLDATAFAEVIDEAAAALPDLCAVFDVQVPYPGRIQSIVEQAQELIVLRNLIGIQEATRARQDADEFEGHARRLAEEVRRDPLTGVYNRSQLESVLKKEFDAASRHGWPLSVAFIDLDNFKQVNDRWGHLVGDEVLRNFAQSLQRQLRASDIVARYGGEEFLIVLPGIAEEVAMGVMRRILSEASQTSMATVEGQPLYVTFSAGLATQGDIGRFANVEALLTAADRALYAAKRDGRNRITAS